MKKDSLYPIQPEIIQGIILSFYFEQNFFEHQKKKMK
jgi:hypothetical protein